MYAREVLGEKLQITIFYIYAFIVEEKKKERERKRRTLLLLHHAFERAKSTIVTHINIQIED